MTRNGTTRSLLVALVLALMLGAAPGNGRADDEDAAPPSRTEGVVYEVFHGDSIHVRGVHVREIHVPSRDLAFYVERGELRVFRPKARRYRLPGETIEFELPGGKKQSLTVFAIPGTETRRVGTLRLLAADIDRLEALLEEKTRLRAVADRYLLPASDFEFVVGYAGFPSAAGLFAAKLLKDSGIRYAGVSNGLGGTLCVPATRAEEARRILYEALVEGLSNPPDEPDRHPGWGHHLDYQVMGPDGTVIWAIDRTLVPPAPPHADVLNHLKRFPGSEVVTVDGETRVPAYGDLGLEEAETVLKGKLSRPWTVKALLTEHRRASDPEGESELGNDAARAALIYLLAASRSPRALPLVGAGLSDRSLEVRVAATEGINTYWNPVLLPIGNLESAMDLAGAWWDAHRR